MAEAQPQQRQIQIRIPDDVLKGHYANIVHITSSKEEFLFDFGTVNAQQGNGIITDRIFMNPTHVKRMIELLQRVMQQYETAHGSVSSAETPQEIGFTTS